MKPLDPRLVQRSSAVRRYLIGSVALGTVTAIAVVAQSWLIAQVVERGFAGTQYSAIAGLLLGLAALFGLRAVVVWLHQVASHRAAAQVKLGLRTEITAAMLDPRRRDARPAGEHVAALLGSGLDNLDDYFAKYLPQLVLAITVPVTVVAAMLLSDITAALTVAVTLPLIPVFMILVGWLTQERTGRRWKALLRLGQHFSDVVEGIVVLKQYGRDQRQVLRHIGEENRRHTMGALRLAFLSTFVLELLATICVALVAVGVGLRIVNGDLALGTGLFVLLLAPEAFLPLRQVGAHFHASADGVAAAQDAFEILDYRAAHGARQSAASSAIVVDDVVVQYPDREPIGPLNFTFKTDQVNVISGASGSGKSTILAVLLGFVEPASGHIRIDGIALDDLDIAAWRKQLAWVPQHPGLLAGTIEANIRFGNDQATTVQVRNALDAAGGASLDLAQQVGEFGSALSAGERRRVAVARALLRVRTQGARWLLLDEPTAGLDAEREDSVLAAVENAAVGVLLVSHRQIDLPHASHELAKAQS